jgi:hypothetical protein
VGSVVLVLFMLGMRSLCDLLGPPRPGSPDLRTCWVAAIPIVLLLGGLLALVVAIDSRCTRKVRVWNWWIRVSDQGHGIKYKKIAYCAFTTKSVGAAEMDMLEIVLKDGGHIEIGVAPSVDLGALREFLSQKVEIREFVETDFDSQARHLRRTSGFSLIGDLVIVVGILGLVLAWHAYTDGVRWLFCVLFASLSIAVMLAGAILKLWAAHRSALRRLHYLEDMEDRRQYRQACDEAARNDRI